MNNNFNVPDIQFDPINHTYTRNGLIYTSATTIVGKYKKPFNRRFWAMYSTLKETFEMYVRADEPNNVIWVNQRPYTLDELYSIEVYKEGSRMMKNGWDDTTKTACDRGNKIHDYLENTINDSKGDNGESNDIIKPLQALNINVFSTEHDLDSTNLKEVYPDIYFTLLYYIQQGCTIYAEKKVYIDTYKVSGMIDCLVIKDNNFMIIDWKTNKDIIHFKSGYYKKQKVGNKYIKTDTWIEHPKYLLDPLNHLEESKGNIYSLQLSLYAYIMESWGYKLINNGLLIFHFRPTKNPERIPIKYMKQDIHTMLEHHNKVT